MAFNVWMTIAGKVRNERAIAVPVRLEPAE
jgi:hypothetical protein